MSVGVGAPWVEDDVAGMPRQVMARMFDPFFTTREVGKGGRFVVELPSVPTEA